MSGRHVTFTLPPDAMMDARVAFVAASAHFRREEAAARALASSNPDEADRWTAYALEMAAEAERTDALRTLFTLHASEAAS